MSISYEGFGHSVFSPCNFASKTDVFSLDLLKRRFIKPHLENMKKILLLSLIITFSSIFGENLFSQDEKKRLVYEFSILSIKSPTEAKIIDDKMMTKLGI